VALDQTVRRGGWEASSMPIVPAFLSWFFPVPMWLARGSDPVLLRHPPGRRVARAGKRLVIGAIGLFGADTRRLHPSFAQIAYAPGSRVQVL
jgi:hypothetical protein